MSICASLCGIHTELARDNQIGCPTLVIQLYSRADFAIREVDVPTSTGDDDKGV